MKSVIVLLALVAFASAVDNCATYSDAPTNSVCSECVADWDLFSNVCVPSACRLNLGGLNMGLFDCVFWSQVAADGTTTYTGTVNITGWNAVQTWPAASTQCFGFYVTLNSTQAPLTNPEKDYTSAVTASWDGAKTVYKWTFPHSDVISNCAEQTIGNKINYTCTWSHQITFRGFEQTEYTFLTNIVIDTGVNNVIDLTVTSLSKTNTCCTIYTYVTSKLDFIPAMGGAIDNTLITYAKNSHWYNRVSITDASYAVYFLNHVKATLGGAGFFYTLAPQTFDNSNAGHIDYDFLATMATNAVVTLNITNTVVLAPTGPARLLLAKDLATQSSGTMNIQGSNNALLTSFAAMLLVVLAIFAF